MAGTIPIWLTGINGGVVVSLTPQTVNASTGVLADTTPVQTVTADLEECDVSAELSNEEISAMTSGRQNEVGLQDRWTIRMVEIMKKASPVSKLLTAYGGADYHKAIFTRGGQTWTGYVLRKSVSEGVRKGKSTVTLETATVDAGALATYV